MGVGGQRHVPATLHPENDRVPLLKEAGWAPGPVWTGAEYLALDPRTVRPVASCYTTYAIPARGFIDYLSNLITVETHLSTVPGISIMKKNNFLGVCPLWSGK